MRFSEILRTTRSSARFVTSSANVSALIFENDDDCPISKPTDAFALTCGIVAEEGLDGSQGGGGHDVTPSGVYSLGDSPLYVILHALFAQTGHHQLVLVKRGGFRLEPL